MKVKELIKQLKKIENQDSIVAVETDASTFVEAYGVALCEEDTSVIICSRETYEAFCEGSD